MTENLKTIFDRLDEQRLIELLTESVEQYSPSFAEEAQEAGRARDEVAQRLQQLLASRDPMDGKDVILEVYNEAGQVVLAYKLYRCWVSEYQALW